MRISNRETKLITKAINIALSDDKKDSARRKAIRQQQKAKHQQDNRSH